KVSGSRHETGLFHSLTGCQVMGPWFRPPVAAALLLIPALAERNTFESGRLDLDEASEDEATLDQILEALQELQAANTTNATELETSAGLAAESEAPIRPAQDEVDLSLTKRFGYSKFRSKQESDLRELAKFPAMVDILETRAQKVIMKSRRWKELLEKINEGHENFTQLLHQFRAAVKQEHLAKVHRVVAVLTGNETKAPAPPPDAEEDAIAEGDDFDEEEEAERDEDADKNTDTKEMVQEELAVFKNVSAVPKLQPIATASSGGAAEDEETNDGEDEDDKDEEEEQGESGRDASETDEDEEASKGANSTL
ncbi:unnamed protein product, partial [Effrenium voratum]